MTDKKHILADVAKIKSALGGLPTHWDGKQAILELKEADYQWRQMEWIGWYFEFICKKPLQSVGFAVPGKKYDNVGFDSFSAITGILKQALSKPIITE